MVKLEKEYITGTNIETGNVSSFQANTISVEVEPIDAQVLLLEEAAK